MVPFFGVEDSSQTTTTTTTTTATSALIFFFSLEVFADAYYKSNPSVFPNADVAFVLAFALIMLNTDAHNPAIEPKNKMTKDQFIWNNRGTWVDGADPPRELLSELYDKVVEEEIKMTGDPDKKGWVKGIYAGPIREGKRWLLLVGNELRWYNGATSGRGDEEIKGKIVLDYVQVEEEDVKFSIKSSIPKNIDFIVYEKGKETPMSCKRFIITLENSTQMKAWAMNVRQNVTFKVVPQLDPKLTSPSKTKRGKGEGGSTPPGKSAPLKSTGSSSSVPDNVRLENKEKAHSTIFGSRT
eukprot:TRINITY_DN1793_c0_g1_i1.p1 TRINITY_DN1793_c0_g1~~TRINITY_DN1793_c0_g1_i1.p1  ORF type:complete len:297 (+),score=83.17 TRINITY_DN1793_c0_g1_i1:10-900(+)